MKRPRLYHLTAVISDKRGRVLSIGQNSYVKTHPMQARYAAEQGVPEKKFLHAEMAAIIRCKDLSKAHTIFVSRFNEDGQPMLAKPCPICMSAIHASGIKQIEWTS